MTTTVPVPSPQPTAGSTSGEGSAPASAPPRTTAARRPVVEVVLTALLAGLAGLGWLGVLPWRALAGPVIAAAALATVLAVLTVRRRRGGALLDLAVSAVGFVVVAGVVLYRPTTWLGVPTVDTLRAIGDGLVNGVARTLATSVPAPAQPSIRLVPFTAAWVAAFWGATLTERSRSVLLPLLGATAALVVGILMSSGGSDVIGVAAGFVAVTVAYVVVRVARLGGVRARSLVRRSLRVGGPLVAVIALVALAAGAVVSFSSPAYDLHDAADTRIDPRESLTPLRQIQARLAAPDPVPMFDLRITDANTTLPNIRLAVLDRYDGAQWSSGETFVPVGPALGPAPASTAASHALTADVTVRDLDDFWLPSLATPVQTTLAGISAGGVSRTLVASQSSVAGMHYTETAQVLDPTPAQLRTAQLATSDPSATDLPDAAPADLAAIKAAATAAVAGATTPYAQIAALQKFLISAPFHSSTDAPAGQSYARIRQLLEVNHTGTSEQFASAFAVMARALGIPTRVVAGFHHGAVRNGSVTVTSADAAAWTEVDLAGLGWVPFESTPGVDPLPAPTTTTPTTTPDSAPGSEAAAGNAPATGAASPVAVAVTPTDWKVIGGWVVLGLVLAVGLIWPVVVVAVRSRRRKRLQRDPSTRVRALGAWRYALEPLTAPEGRALSTLTVAEVDDLVADRFGEPLRAELVGVGAAANRARFDPAELDAEEAARAWRDASTFRGAADRKRRWRDRLVTALDPRTLRRPS